MNVLRSPSAFAAVSLLMVVQVVPRAHALSGQLRVEPRLLDFGSTGHGQKPFRKLTLRNVGDQPVRVLRIEGSCGCLSWQPWISTSRTEGGRQASPRTLLRPIAPGTALDLRVTMASGRATGQLNKYITITTNGNPRMVKVPTRLSVFPEVAAVEPPQLRFQAELNGAPLTETLEIRLRQSPAAAASQPVEFRVDDVRDAKQSLATVFSSRVEDLPAGKRLHLTLKPGLPEGRFMATIQAHLGGKPFQIPVSGEVFRGIKVSPTYFNFNRVEPEVAESLVEEARLTTIGGRPFKILAVEVRLRERAFDGMDVKVTHASPDGGKTHVLEATVVLPEPLPGAIDGRFSGEVFVKTDHPEKPQVRLNLFGFFPKPKPQRNE